jgi:exopolysaccharide biosynthesis polyprenyl glycosylphosphotransferase
VNPLLDTVPVQGVVECIDRVSVDTVCVTPGSQFTGERLRVLGWALADRGVNLITVPGHVETSPRRIRLETVGGVTLLHTFPAAEGMPRVVKSTLDRAVAVVALIVASPLLVGIVVAVRLSGPGPVFFRQTRVGHGERPFTMVKFRTMRVDADREREKLADLNEHDGHMFKMRDDPRVTKVGRWLRRYSLDELPQLWNVLRGEMSLVGPRPPLADEVAGYDSVEHRRLSVVPGMTGLWQVSGRSALSWDATVRLDLRYVDNWSLGMDAKVLLKTGRAVVRGTGAY